MPKEVIPTCSGGPYEVRVGWDPNQHVQVGVESVEQRSLPWVLYGDPETLRALGAQVRQLVRREPNTNIVYSSPARPHGQGGRGAFEHNVSTGSSTVDVVASPAADEEFGRHILNLLDVLAGSVDAEYDPQNGSNEPHHTYMGIWSDLDRRGCNELIRVLRRARDAAFGRDE